MNPNNNYLKYNLNGEKIDSIKIWKISQSSPYMLTNNDGSFNGIKQPKEVKKECLTDKKIYRNKRNGNKNKEQPPQSIEEYLNILKGTK